MEKGLLSYMWTMEAQVCIYYRKSVQDKPLSKKVPYLEADVVEYTDEQVRPFPTYWWYIVCVEVLRPSQPNGVMSSVVSLPNHTFTGQA